MNFIIKNFKKPKTILIVLGLTGIIVFSVMLVGYGSYLGALIIGPGTPVTICTDPDGENLFQKGTTKQITGGHTSTYYDQCQNGKVHEWYCEGNQAEVKNISCPDGYSCVDLTDGKCTKVTEPDPTCEADGKCKYPGCPAGDPDCNCTEQGGNICQTNETCLGTSLSYSGSGTCCSVACAPAAIYSISGRIISSEDISSSRIAINLTGTSSASTVTDSFGSYSFINLTDGSYTITPSDNNYIFSPISNTITIPKGCATTNMANRNFNAISKECNSGETKNHTCQDGTEVDWCSCDNYKWACIDSPEVNCPATCEADGKCKYPGCPAGDPDCNCTEQGGNICQTNETCLGTSLSYSGSGTCCSVACAPAAIYSISGRIISSEDISSSRIAINLTGTSSASTVTDSFGSYSFINLTDGSYVVAPSDGSYTFDPIYINITMSGNNVTDQNFTAVPVLCDQYFEVQNENSTPIAGVEIFAQGAFSEISRGPVCNTDNTGRCFLSFRWTEKNHTVEASKDGYECYNNECQRTFDGCLSEAIVLKLKKSNADFQTADLDCNGSVNLTDYSILMSFWHKDPSGYNSCQSPDIDKDGDVDLPDASILMSQWTEKKL